LFPKHRNVEPRYQQITLDSTKQKNEFAQILSPNEEDEGVWIHQDAWFHLGTFDNGISATYPIKKQGNGVYAFVLKGSFKLDGIEITNRDGLGIWETEEFILTSSEDDSEILLMEVPM
jgi:redox-sensitive bicupin YhaK (pirin superfamily)